MKVAFETSKRLRDSLSGFPRAFRTIYSRWAVSCIEPLKRSAAKLKKTAHRKRAWGKSGDLARNIGYELKGNEKEILTTIGTGVGGKKNVVYAYIQDRGGTIRAKGKKLTVPLGNTVGRIADYPDGFFLKSKKGNVLYCRRDGKKLIPLFILKDEVNIPGTDWFSSVMNGKKKELERALDPENVFRISLELGRKQ